MSGLDGGQCPSPRDVRVRDERYSVACGSRECAVCGERWERDQRVRAVAASEHLGAAVALVTVTAPGRGYFSWGPAGSYDNPTEQMADWNRSARQRFTGLHRQASKEARRSARAAGCDWRLLYRSWEYQKRGALHVHLVLPFGTPAEREATGRYVNELHNLRDRWAFGHVLGGQRERHRDWSRPPRVAAAESSAAARYVCKYVASIGSGKESMRTVAQRSAKRGSVLYISPALTRRSGVTMTTLRNRRRVWARYPWARSSADQWRTACVVDAVQRRRAPLTTAGEARLAAAVSRSGVESVLDASTGELIERTAAPMPLVLVGTSPGCLRHGRLTVVSLASVWLGVPKRPELGHVRTEVVL